MKFSESLAEIDGDEDLQVHSYWVAKNGWKKLKKIQVV